jgi:hypothetical protein
MSNETSPLNAKLEAAQNKADEAGKAISAYARSFANGNFSIRMLALVGGVLLCLDSLVTFAENLYNLEINHAVIDMYAFAVGFAAIVMESDQEAIPYAIKIRTILGKNVGIVRTVTGRGLFYGVAASLELNDVSIVRMWIDMIYCTAIIDQRPHHQLFFHVTGGREISTHWLLRFGR